jgi:hypothetical protein
MQIEIDRTRPRVFTARQVPAFDRADVVHRLFAGQDTYDDFMIVGQLARPSAETRFDVCTDGTELFVSVLLFDSGMSLLRQWPCSLDQGVGPNSVEVLFCPYGDGIGFLQFGVGPGTEMWFNHHWPYRDERPHLAARPVWDASFRYEAMGEDLAWIAFLRFAMAGIAAEGSNSPIGFNVMRTQLHTQESATASHASGSGFPDATSCGWLRLSTQTPAPLPPLRCSTPAVPGVQLQGTYDFPDEMVGGIYTPDALRHELRLLREHGFGRVYWIDYPRWITVTQRLLADPQAEPTGDAQWDGLWRRLTQNFGQTLQAFGGDPMPVCARLAHEEGLEFFTVMKPYDALNTELPDCSFARNPAWLPPSDGYSAERLTLFADNDAPLPFPVSDVRLYASRDNRNYELCSQARITERVIARSQYIWTPAGKWSVPGEEKVRTLEIDDVPRDAQYLAVEFPPAATPGAFGNQRYLLAEAGAAAVTLSQRPQGEDFRTTGFDFCSDGSSAGWADCSEGIELRRAMPAGTALGIRFGCDAAHTGMPDPAFAQVREFWLRNWVQRAIDAGADGVDVRIAFHTRCDEWLSYAFAEPILQKFRDQTGRDPEPRHEDYATIRRIRGGFHTQFLRDAKTMLQAAGKRLEAHVEARMKTPPEHDTYAQIHWDYATWIDESIVDGVNLKYLGPFNSFVQEQILPRARQRDIPVHVIASVGDPRTVPRTPEWTTETLALIQSAGLNGLNLYELWTYMRTTPRGEPFLRGCARSVLAELKNLITA